MGKKSREPEKYQIKGTLEEAETGSPLANLIVRAFDRDLILDDKVGFATTDEAGRFEIRFGPEMFRDVIEARPDLYLRIYDRTGTRLIHETTDQIRWNAKTLEHFAVKIPARSLDPRR
jgi:hypothetical protein